MAKAFGGKPEVLIFIMTLLVFVVLIGALLLVISVLNCWWRLFQKAGIPAWKAFVPYVNVIHFFGIMSDGSLFYGLLNTGGLLMLLGILMSSGHTETGIIISAAMFLLGLLVTIGFHVYNAVRGAAHFRKSDGFKIGMALLPIPFYTLLAFDKSKYYNY